MINGLVGRVSVAPSGRGEVPVQETLTNTLIRAWLNSGVEHRFSLCGPVFDSACFLFFFADYAGVTVPPDQDDGVCDGV